MTSGPPTGAAGLVRGPSLRELIEELSDSPTEQGRGGSPLRVGLSGALTRLRRRGRRADVPADAAVAGFTWDLVDRWTLRWYAQGITTSADAGPSGSASVGERRVLLVSWYAKPTRGGLRKGARITVVDNTDPSRPRYDHVLLVEPYRGADGAVDLRPVRVHAGGIAWSGHRLLVADTWRGLRVFDLRDVLAVTPRGPGGRSLVGRQPDGTYAAFGFALALPQESGYRAWTAPGERRLRYSFLSLDRTGTEPQLVAGEYGRDGAPTRLFRIPMDPRTQLPRADADGRVRLTELRTDGVERMQGVVVVDGRYAITVSRGRTSRGDLWTGRPGDLVRQRGVLAVGPEDICYVPDRGQLWTATEWPGRRFVYALDAARWLP